MKRIVVKHGSERTLSVKDNGSVYAEISLRLLLVF